MILFLQFQFLSHYFLDPFLLIHPLRYWYQTYNLIKKKSSTVIFYHIHEWRCRCCLVKVFISNQILVEWFKKSLLLVIIEDETKGSVVIEEQVISHAKYLDLVYTQSGTLYKKILDLPRPGQITTTPSDSHVAAGVLGFFSTYKSKKKHSK